MIRALSIDLVKLLQKEGGVMVDDLKGTTPKAEGKLIDSYEHDVDQEGSIIRLTLKAAPHFRFVELGRKPGGKMPPLMAIKKWTAIKGIPVRAAFPIAKAIAKRGIAPKHMLKNAIPQWEKTIREKIRQAFGEAMKIEGENMIKRFMGK